VAVLVTLTVIAPAGRARRERGRGRVDLPGAVIVTSATGSVIYGLINAGSHGWLAVSALAPVAAAAGLYAVFGLTERRMAAPLMDVRLLRRAPVAAGASGMLIATGLLVGAFFLGSFYLQGVRGYSALHTGLAFLPPAVAATAGAFGAGHLAALVDRRVLASGSLTLAAIGALVAAYWHGPVPLVTGMCVAALGLGSTLVAATTTALADVEPHEAGLRSGIINTFHELGSAMGVAVLSSLAAPSLAAASATGSRATVSAASGAGFTRAFTVSALVAVAAALLAALIVPPGKAAAGSMPHGH
jgi:hypothetical protein